MINLIELQGVELEINNTRILYDIDLTIKNKEIVTVIGHNGAGKTSLLNIMCNLIKQTKGKVILKPNMKIGYMPQKLDMSRLLILTVNEFLKLLLGDKSLLEQQKGSDLYYLLNIECILNKRVRDLSGGEFKRLLLTQAVLREPDLLVLDEPVSNMDVVSSSKFYDILDKVYQQLQCAIVMVSHDLHMVMGSAHRVVCLNGHICCEGKFCDIKNDDEVRKLFNLTNESNLKLYIHEHDHRHS